PDRAEPRAQKRLAEKDAQDRAEHGGPAQHRLRGGVRVPLDERDRQRGQQQGHARPSEASRTSLKSVCFSVGKGRPWSLTPRLRSCRSAWRSSSLRKIALPNWTLPAV